MSTLSLSESRQAVRIGVARAMSEAGFIPSEAEVKLASSTLNKKADVLGFLEKLVTTVPPYVVLASAGIGAYAGHLHHAADKALSGEDDPEINTIKKKTDAYRKMTADLAQTEAATQPIVA